jgi:serine/threonine protein kinase
MGIMKSRVGTAYYVAPEVLLTDDYTSKCDIWSIGVITFVLLCGFPPFFAENEKLTLTLVQKAEVVFPSPAWDDISEEAKVFVKYLLDEDPEKRPTATEALKHSWLNQAKVQPGGVSRRATFACHQRKSSLEDTAPIRMKTRKHTIFQKLLVAAKIKKSHKHSASSTS